MESNNPTLNYFKPYPICDSHVHLTCPCSVEESVQIYDTIIRHCNYERLALNALPIPKYTVTDNLLALYCKARLPQIYVNVGLTHYGDERDTAQEFLAQIKCYHAMGADGIKMLEGKPDQRRKYGIPVDSPVYDLVFDYAEKQRLPVVMHVGDPSCFWDVDRIPRWALERGWLYDESYVPLEDLRSEIDGVLQKHPKLPLILAHFYFLSEDIEKATAFMEKWENVCLDLTPGQEMFIEFSKQPDAWRAFFEKYADRILFGTDLKNAKQEKSADEQYCYALNLVRSSLERKEEFLAWWVGKPLHPLCISDEAQHKIYCDNFHRLYRERNPLNAAMIARQAKCILQQSENLTEMEKQNLATIQGYFES